MLDPVLKTDTVWIGPDQPIDDAINMMEEISCHHLPVVQDHRLVGMLSDRDILTTVGWKLCSERQCETDNRVVGPQVVKDIMRTPVYTIHRDSSISHAAHIMATHRVGALPVMDDNTLVGMVTGSDLLRLATADHAASREYDPVFERRVSELMTAPIVTVHLNTGIDEIGDLMCKHRFRHFPVVVGGDLLVGMVSDRDFRRAIGEATIHDAQAEERGELYIGPTTANDIMQRNVKTIEKNAIVRAVAERMLAHRIHAMPVMDGDELAGIVTDRDIVTALGWTSGAREE